MAITTLNNRSINRSDTASAGQVWTATSATAADFQAAVGGKIGQVVQTVHTGTETLSSNSATTISNFTVSITPAASSSKILVIIDMNTGGHSNYNTNLQLFRDTTQIYMGDAAGSRERTFAWFHVTNSRFNRRASGATYLDSPSTTSSQAYTVGISGSGATDVRAQPDSKKSSIILMEIAG